MDGNQENPVTPGEQLEQQYGITGYQREDAYEATRALFDSDNAVVESYIAPVEALDRSEYDGNAPMDTFEEKFRRGLKAYDSRTASAFEPVEDGLYDGLDDDLLNRKAPVTGADIANAFLDADNYEEGRAELERFEQWMKPTLDQTEFRFDEAEEPLQPEQYHHAVIMHSFQRMIQRKYNNKNREEPDRFEPSEGGRNIDLASRL